MTDKDPNTFVDDRDQNYYDQVFGETDSEDLNEEGVNVVSDTTPITKDSFVDDRDEAYYNRVFQDQEVDKGRDSYNEEFATEAIDPSLITRGDVETNAATGTGIGWLALALSVIGLFFLPIIMGIAGIIVGFIARGQGARGLGAWAIGIGAAVILLRLVAYPFL